MDRNEIQKRVRSVIAEELGIAIEAVTENADFRDDLGADSLDAVEIVMAMEDEFDFCIPEADEKGLRTVGELVDYIEGKMRNEK